MPEAKVQVKPSDHYNDWPNTQGFIADVEQRQPVELRMAGSIPTYASGNLYRTGPGRNSVPTKSGQIFQLSHWIDGFSQTHRFQIVADQNCAGSRVFYSSRFADQGRYDYIKENGQHPPYPTFGGSPDPCEAIFKDAQSEWDPADPTVHNINVTLSYNMPGSAKLFPQIMGRNPDSQKKDLLIAKTDAPVYKALDFDTMEPLAVATQDMLHPDLTGELAASHARSDPQTGDVFNYQCTSDSESSIYRVFTISASTQETTILAKFEDRPAYLHSLFLTKDYVVLCVWNSYLKIKSTSPTAPIIDKIQPFDPTVPSHWYVVDRTGTQGLVAKYDGPAFFCFHTINAWQELSPTDGRDTDIVTDLIMYDNLDSMYWPFYKNILSDSKEARVFVDTKPDSMRGSLTRFRLPSVGKVSPGESLQVTMEWKTGKNLSPELPTYNGTWGTRQTRYTYTLTNQSKSTMFDGIAKFDNGSLASLWEAHGQTPSEAIFVPNPKGTAEDDGVLLSVVLDGYVGKSYLLCLDAKTMLELGRACAELPVAFSFHGQHISTKGATTGDF
ncbi:uncharacterized protein A1O9_13020 [Exophiala aquamarina CBS 119918]|uniref:Dioxygenase n=1 Tax=Exophiala aquamarina CBS 119918 TaxID=1182545 RepID=A0A072NV54_9EURO|nr:uncharacterized protein A1O9_13020 [Exophiala aquamarina CBS 119918]KEF50928.1 hypothetical protein A1O9_13020 [Exophiala aquamarina CBS 119918]